MSLRSSLNFLLVITNLSLVSLRNSICDLYCCKFFLRFSTYDSMCTSPCIMESWFDHGMPKFLKIESSSCISFIISYTNGNSEAIPCVNTLFLTVDSRAWQRFGKGPSPSNIKWPSFNEESGRCVVALGKIPIQGQQLIEGGSMVLNHFTWANLRDQSFCPGFWNMLKTDGFQRLRCGLGQIYDLQQFRNPYLCR